MSNKRKHEVDEYNVSKSSEKSDNITLQRNPEGLGFGLQYRDTIYWDYASRSFSDLIKSGPWRSSSSLNKTEITYIDRTLMQNSEIIIQRLENNPNEPLQLRNRNVERGVNQQIKRLPNNGQFKPEATSTPKKQVVKAEIHSEPSFRTNTSNESQPGPSNIKSNVTTIKKSNNIEMHDLNKITKIENVSQDTTRTPLIKPEIDKKSTTFHNPLFEEKSSKVNTRTKFQVPISTNTEVPSTGLSNRTIANRNWKVDATHNASAQLGIFLGDLINKTLREAYEEKQEARSGHINKWYSRVEINVNKRLNQIYEAQTREEFDQYSEDLIQYLLREHPDHLFTQYNAWRGVNENDIYPGEYDAMLSRWEELVNISREAVMLTLLNDFESVADELLSDTTTDTRTDTSTTTQVANTSESPTTSTDVNNNEKEVTKHSNTRAGASTTQAQPIASNNTTTTSENPSAAIAQTQVPEGNLQNQRGSLQGESGNRKIQKKQGKYFGLLETVETTNLTSFKAKEAQFVKGKGQLPQTPTSAHRFTC